MTHRFHIGISSDFKTEAPGKLDPLLATVVDPLEHVTYHYFDSTGADDQGPFVLPADIAAFDAVIALGPRFVPVSFAADNRLAIIARWGVGYDSIDVNACTAADVLLAITVDAVRRPVAEAVVTLLLALAKRLMDKDRVVRQARWELRGAAPAVGLRGKTLGMLGLGNIGSEVFRLLEPFALGRKLAADPYCDPEHAASLGVELVDLETLFGSSDFISINAMLTDETFGLVDARLIDLMRPSAYLINTARGPIVNQDDLVAALQAERIAGAGLDVFAEEPLPRGHPLTTLDNVILAPHSLAWTDDVYHDNSAGAVNHVLSTFRGEAPAHTVNKDVLQRPTFQAKLAAFKERWNATQI